MNYQKQLFPSTIHPQVRKQLLHMKSAATGGELLVYCIPLAFPVDTQRVVGDRCILLAPQLYV